MVTIPYTHAPPILANIYKLAFDLIAFNAILQILSYCKEKLSKKSLVYKNKIINIPFNVQ